VSHSTSQQQRSRKHPSVVAEAMRHPDRRRWNGEVKQQAPAQEKGTVVVDH
jgi:hypothetical protein